MLTNSGTGPIAELTPRTIALEPGRRSALRPEVVAPRRRPAVRHLSAATPAVPDAKRVGRDPASLEPVYRYSDSIAALAMALFVVGATWPDPSGQAGGWSPGSRAALVGVLVWSWPLLGAWSGLYRGDSPAPAEVMRRVAVLCGLGSIFPVLYALSLPDMPVGAVALLFWSGTVAGAIALRRTIRWTMVGAAEVLPRQVIIAGSGPRAVQLFRQLREESPTTIVPVGFVDDRDHGLGQLTGLPLLGEPRDLERLLMRRVVDEVLIALPIRSGYSAIQEVINVCERTGTEAKYLADIFDSSRARPRYEMAGRTRLVSMKVTIDARGAVFKRMVDLVGAMVALVAASPLMLLIAMAVKLTSRGPVFFTQERYGQNKERFRIYKFRTMVPGAEELQSSLESLNECRGPVFKIRRDPRVTPIGRLLRRTSLDELPQLLNVIRGEMSLVGPRPLPVRDVIRFDEPAYLRRFSIRPGITGLWQVSGRSEVPFDQWINLDLQYIDRWSMALDLTILARTVPAVLSGRGAQ